MHLDASAVHKVALNIRFNVYITLVWGRTNDFLVYRPAVLGRSNNATRHVGTRYIVPA